MQQGPRWGSEAGTQLRLRLRAWQHGSMAAAPHAVSALHLPACDCTPHLQDEVLLNIVKEAVVVVFDLAEPGSGVEGWGGQAPTAARVATPSTCGSSSGRFSPSPLCNLIQCSLEKVGRGFGAVLDVEVEDQVPLARLDEHALQMELQPFPYDTCKSIWPVQGWWQPADSRFAHHRSLSWPGRAREMINVLIIIRRSVSPISQPRAPPSRPLPPWADQAAWGLEGPPACPAGGVHF